MKLLDCGHEESAHSDITVGYGTDDNGKKYCYDCCLRMDLDTLAKTGKIYSYLNSNGSKVTTWPGLKIADVLSIECVNRGFCGRLYHWSGRTIAGQKVYGKGSGFGMCTSIRLYKNEKSNDNKL